MSFEIRAALSGNLEKIMREEVGRAEKAVTGAMRAASDGLKNELRTQVRGAGLGDKLAKAWRADVYPRSGASLGAVGTVFSKAPKVHAVFARGATIKSSSGLWLAIPTENAPKRGVGGKRIDPSNFPEERFGKLRFVFRRGGPSLLVVDGLRQSRGKRGGFRRGSARAQATGKGLATVVMFILVPQARIRKRFDAEFSFGKWAARVPALIDIGFRRLDAESAR